MQEKPEDKRTHDVIGLCESACWDQRGWYTASGGGAGGERSSGGIYSGPWVVEWWLLSSYIIL